MGRLTRDPDVRYSQAQGNEPAKCVARYNLAVDRRYKREGDEQTADFIQIVAFGKAGEFVEKYLKKGTKVIVTGRIQTGSYVNKDGNKIYTTDIVAEDQEFAESRKSADSNTAPVPDGDFAPSSDGGFMNIPDGIDEELPFN